MRPLSLALLLAMAIVASCDGSDPAATSLPSGATSPATSTSSSAPPPVTTNPATSTTTNTPSTTATPPPPTDGSIAPILVSNRDGVFTMGDDGQAIRIVPGPVTVAIDDSRGGLLYQTESGVALPPEGTDASTVVWWLPTGAAAPRDLLVPSPGHRLVLEDAVDRDGHLAVLYTRFEGAPGDAAEMSLRRYDVDSRSVSELWSQGAWEEGFRSVSTGGDLIAFTSHGQISSWLTFLDLDGSPAGNVVEPVIDPRCEADCPVGVQLSPTGDRFAYIETTSGNNGQSSRTVVVRTTFYDGEVLRVGLGDTACCVTGLDLSERAVLINREIRGEPGPPLLVALDTAGDPALVELPIAGIGRFAKGKVLVGDAAAASDYYSLVGRDPSKFPDTPFGVAFVDFGDPVDELLAEFGPPDEGHLDEGVWSLGDGASISRNAVEGSALWARAPTDSGVRLALYDGLVLGRSTVAEMHESWGAPLHTEIGDCPAPYADPLCASVVYTSWATELSFVWTGTTTPEPDRVLEGIRIVELNWPMFFLDGGAVALGTVAEDCGDHGCTIRSDWLSLTGLGPLYSWGADCLDDSCEFVAMFLGTTPPGDVPAAQTWRVQKPEATGGLLLARRLADGGFEVLDSSYASQSSERPLLGPSNMPSPSLFRYVESTDEPQYTAWEIDLSSLDIERLGCDGPAAGDCRPVFDG